MQTLKTLLCILTLVLTAGMGYANDYIYPVTIGSSWAREQFPAQERMQRKKNRETPPLEGSPKFCQLFHDLHSTYQKYNNYNDSIFYRSTHEEWISMFKRRAQYFSSAYSSNNKQLTELRDYFAKDDLPEQAYDSLYYWTRHIFFRNLNDIFLYEQLIDILLPHYEETHDTEHLVFCYMCRGCNYFQSARLGERGAAEQSLEFFKKVYAMRENFATFKDPLNRYYIIASLTNLTNLHCQAGTTSIEESYDYIDEMHEIYTRPETQEVLRQDSLLNEFTLWTADLFRFRAIVTYISQEKNKPALRDRLYADYRRAMDNIHDDFNNLKNRYYAKLPYDNLLIEAYMGHITWDYALNQFEKLMNEDSDLQQDTGVPTLKITYINNLSQSYLLILENSKLSKEAKRQLVKTHLDNTLNLISRYDHSRYPVEKGTILAKLATKPTLLKYLTSEERTDLLFRLIVVEQPTTYVHVSMVADLSIRLAESMIKHKPEYFVGVPGFENVDDVKDKSKALLYFVYQAAIYHDLGKISMSAIVNNCSRKLTQRELDIVQYHPEQARPFLRIDDSLKPYMDVALGHHKWYDGDGYPSKFKNRQSPYFPIINIVTLCDCMDAATETIGRNYHRPKSFETVMSEFEDYEGTRYDPVLINQIQDDPLLFNLLKTTVDIGRYNHYYKMYMQYFKM